jgi:hypothetical protein
VDTGDPTAAENDVEVCSNCGYEISGIPNVARCPECGATMEPGTTDRMELPAGTPEAWRKPVIPRPATKKAGWVKVIGLVLLALAVVAVVMMWK